MALRLQRSFNSPQFVDEKKVSQKTVDKILSCDIVFVLPGTVRREGHSHFEIKNDPY